MATIWQYPRTWAGGDLASASTATLGLNRDIRDNMLASQAVIAETIVTSTATSIVSNAILTPFSTRYNNFKIVGSAASAGALSASFFMWLNNDLSTLYQQSALAWRPSSSVAGVSTGSVLTGQIRFTFDLVNGQDVPNAMTSFVINIAAANSTYNKLVTAIHSEIQDTARGNAPVISMTSGIYRSTAAITNIHFAAGTSTGPFSIGSIFTLIGLP